MSINSIVRSKGYKSFMAKLYGIGASVVILGALFKINHYPGANYMLIAGMGVEAIIFFFSAFEPMHVEYDWSLVYPELAGMSVSDKIPQKTQKAGSVTQQLDAMLTEAKIGPELINSLGQGLKNLSETTSQLGSLSSATVAADKFVKNMEEAGQSVTSLSDAYKKAAENVNKDVSLSDEYLASVKNASSAITNLANIYNETASALSKGDTSYTEELKRMAGSLSSINALYELQIQNATAQLDATKQVQDKVQTLVTNFADSSEEVLRYKQQVDALSQKVTALNTVYGNMLAAMQAK